MRRALFFFIASGLVIAATSACRDANPPAAARLPQAAQPSVGAPQPSTDTLEALLRLPRRNGSVRFAVIGDAGRGDLPQYQVSALMQAYRRVFPFDFVVMLGDNVYDGGTAADYREKFERPYKPLLDAGVQFFATIGNHDDPNQPAYKPFHMNGRRYYSFKPASIVSQSLGADVEFFMIDTEFLNLTQRAWIVKAMSESKAEWKIPVFHRPIYTSGRYELPGRFLRGSLEPVFSANGVSVAFSGHEHFYERSKPQQGITYFISGAAGSLRVGDLRPTGFTAAGFDRDYHFMLVEIDGQTMHYQAISRGGVSVDAGVIYRPGAIQKDTVLPTLSPAPSP